MRKLTILLFLLSSSVIRADFDQNLAKAQRGDAAAQNEVGYEYEQKKDYTQAVYWYRKAAEQGNIYAQYNLGRCYYYGQGVTKDYEQAVYWFRKTAEQNYANSQNYLGLCYENGQGVTQDYTQAVYWYRKSAEQGNMYAQYNLGVCYYYGQVIAQDYTQAVYWYRKAAEQNYALAQNNLGLCYENGQGVTKDYEQAAYWFRKSAEQGNTIAQKNLGNFYKYGKGVEQNNDMAQYWYDIADGKRKLESKQSVNPPLLALVDNSLQLVEQNANNTIDANEQCKIRFKITNNGKGPAIGCEVKIKGTGSTLGLTFASQQLQSIAVGATQTIEIPVTANTSTTNGTVSFAIEVTEPNGYGIDPMTLTVNTRAFDAPMLKIVDYAVSGDGTLQRKKPFDLQLMLQNTNYGKAEDIDISIILPTDVNIWEGQQTSHLPSLDGGQSKQLNYQLAISGNYAGNTVPIQITLKEKHGRYAENKTINLALNQQLVNSPSVTLKGEEPQKERGNIQLASIGSAVDKNIPSAVTRSAYTFAFIISNETYQHVSSVPMALNDGAIFRQYCQQTLGLPAENIKYYPNATLGNMAAAVQQAKDIANAYQGKLNIIFYYAGHGIPDNETKEAYLLPVDASGSQTTYCYSIDRLYRELGSTNANKIIVLLDACFSGAQRGEGMLASARGVALKAKSGVPQGNMVVMSAATGDQTAFPYEAEGHGMFTFFLLKKLQETSGEVSLQDLYDYIRQNVAQKTSVVINKLQTPTLNVSTSLGDSWQGWKLK